MDQKHQFSDLQCAEAEPAVRACIRVRVTCHFQGLASARPDMTVPR